MLLDVVILRPISDASHPAAALAAEPLPVWSAVKETQSRRAAAYRLITQPDHAALAGEIAAGLDAHSAPALEPLHVRAIGLHDAGWSLLDGVPSDPAAAASGTKPLSFLEVAPAVLVRAFTASVEAGALLGAIVALIISGHFCRIARNPLNRLDSRPNTAEDELMLRQFLEQEERRGQALAAHAPSAERMDELVNVLQFCDQVSLYLCCGSQQPVELPRFFAPRPVRLRWEDGACVLEPSPLTRPLTLNLRAQHFPRRERAPEETLVFKVR